jgi:hypothetical protein
MLTSCLPALGLFVKVRGCTAHTKSNDDLEGMMLSSTALDMESHLVAATALEVTYKDRQPEVL